MIRFLNAYFPARTVLLGASEAMLAAAAFVLAIIAAMGPFDAQMFISYEQGGARIALVVGIFVLCMYYFDLYDSTVLRSQREVFTRLIQVFGTVCIILACVYALFPAMRLQQSVFTARSARRGFGNRALAAAVQPRQYMAGVHGAGAGAGRRRDGAGPAEGNSRSSRTRDQGGCPHFGGPGLEFLAAAGNARIRGRNRPRHPGAASPENHRLHEGAARADAG